MEEVDARRGWCAGIVLFRSDLVKPVGCDLVVVEGYYLALQMLQRIVPFSADQDGVTAGSLCEGGVDRPLTVWADDGPVRTTVAVQYVMDNLERMFIARVVSGNDCYVGCLFGDTSKQGSLRRSDVTGGSYNADQSSSGHLPQGVKGSRKRVRRAAPINKNAERLTAFDSF